MIESLASGDHTRLRARAGRACALASGAGGRSGTVAGKRKSKGTGRKQTRAARFGGLAEDAVRGAEDAEDEAVERTGRGVAGGDGSKAEPGPGAAAGDRARAWGGVTPFLVPMVVTAVILTKSNP